MGNAIRVVNIEVGMPTVNAAEQRLLSELRQARVQRVAALKVIHGYGSTGVGGKIKDAIRKILEYQRSQKKIKAFVPGDKWSIFEAGAREVLEGCPDLRRDQDLENCNAGITIILL